MTRDEAVALERRFQAAVEGRDLAMLEELLAPEFTLTTGRAAAPFGRAPSTSRSPPLRT